MPTEMRAVEAPHMNVQRTGLEAIHMFLANHVTAFYLGPENSSEAGPESNGLICLVKGIFKKG